MEANVNYKINNNNNSDNDMTRLSETGNRRFEPDTCSGIHNNTNIETSGQTSDLNNSHQSVMGIDKEDTKPKITEGSIPDIVWRLYGIKVNRNMSCISLFRIFIYLQSVTVSMG